MTDPREYFKYLADPDHGLVIEKSIAGIKYKVKYLPEDYLKYNSKTNDGTGAAAQNEYASSVTFLLNVGPADNENFDITRVGIESYQEFAERVELMAFDAAQWISLQTEDSTYKPSIVRLENVNAQERGRNFVVVFSSEKGTPADIRKKDMSFTYNDEMFNTGVNKFVFRSRDIESLPQFKF
jgi:hypothetical protein